MKALEPAHSISLLVSNKPGVLVRIALVFSRRGYNIDSLVVSPGNDERFSRMNITARGRPETLVQIIAQLAKLVDVVHATDHTGEALVEKELALVKIHCGSEDRSELLQILEHFKAITVDMTATSLVVQATGGPEKIDALNTMLDKFDVREFIRTGKVIMARGEDNT